MQGLPWKGHCLFQQVDKTDFFLIEFWQWVLVFPGFIARNQTKNLATIGLGWVVDRLSLINLEETQRLRLTFIWRERQPCSGPLHVVFKPLISSQATGLWADLTESLIWIPRAHSIQWVDVWLKNWTIEKERADWKGLPEWLGSNYSLADGWQR